MYPAVETYHDTRSCTDHKNGAIPTICAVGIARFRDCCVNVFLITQLDLSFYLDARSTHPTALRSSHALDLFDRSLAIQHQLIPTLSQTGEHGHFDRLADRLDRRRFENHITQIIRHGKQLENRTPIVIACIETLRASTLTINLSNTLNVFPHALRLLRGRLFVDFAVRA